MLDLAMNDRVRSIIDAMGLKIIGTNVDTLDWNYTTRTPAERVSAITQPIRDCTSIAGCGTKDPNFGGIILQHDFPNAFAIPEVLDIMRSTSFNLTTSSQCAGYDAYSGDWLSRILGEDTTPRPSTTSQGAASESFTTPSLDNKKGVDPNTGNQKGVDPNIGNAASGFSFSGIGTFLIVAITIFLYV